jgi:biotin carboxyl carrier protein
MAELTRAQVEAGGIAGDEAEAQPAPVADDPRAVRVGLAPASRLADEPVLRVAPAAEGLHPANPTVGTGPLGGAAVPPAVPDDGAVRAQRHPLVDGEPADVMIRAVGRGRHVLGETGRQTRVVLEPYQKGPGRVLLQEVLVDGFRFEVELEPERIAALRERATKGRESSAHSGPLEVRAIIPGKVVAVSVGPGDEVTAGQQLLVVEAMKMQNELRAPKDGTIDRVGVAPGINIEVGDLLMVIS